MVAAVIPPGTDGIRVFAGHTVGDWKVQIGGDLRGFFQGINRAGNDRRTKRFEFLQTFFVAG